MQEMDCRRYLKTSFDATTLSYTTCLPTDGDKHHIIGRKICDAYTLLLPHTAIQIGTLIYTCRLVAVATNCNFLISWRTDTAFLATRSKQHLLKKPPQTLHFVL